MSLVIDGLRSVVGASRHIAWYVAWQTGADLGRPSVRTPAGPRELTR